MAKRKRWQSPQEKRARRIRLIVYACLFLIPTTLGTASEAIRYLLPSRYRFGETRQTDTAPADVLPAARRYLTAAAVGAVVGATACALFATAGRLIKKR